MSRRYSPHVMAPTVGRMHKGGICGFMALGMLLASASVVIGGFAWLWTAVS